MKKIKGQGMIVKLVMSRVALNNRTIFANYIANSNNLKALSRDVNNGCKIDIQLVSFSSKNDFSEQVLSILSFIKYVGQPSSWIIYSDGTHNSELIELLETSFPFLQVVNVEFNKLYVRKNINDRLKLYEDCLFNYAQAAPLGKRLFLYLNFDIEKPTLFLDADVLFYEKSSCLRSLVNDSYNGWFLPDAGWGTLDSRYVNVCMPQHYQVNAGFFLVNKALLNLDGGLGFLKSLEGKYEYFSEQNVMHILLIDNEFMPLDPRRFILDSGDQFDFSYLLPFDKIAIRHYTGPVRHKMWQAGWRNQLKI